MGGGQGFAFLAQNLNLAVSGGSRIFVSQGAEVAHCLLHDFDSLFFPPSTPHLTPFYQRAIQQAVGSSLQGDLPNDKGTIGSGSFQPHVPSLCSLSSYYLDELFPDLLGATLMLVPMLVGGILGLSKCRGSTVRAREAQSTQRHPEAL